MTFDLPASSYSTLDSYGKITTSATGLPSTKPTGTIGSSQTGENSAPPTTNSASSSTHTSASSDSSSDSGSNIGSSSGDNKSSGTSTTTIIGVVVGVVGGVLLIGSIAGFCYFLGRRRRGQGTRIPSPPPNPSVPADYKTPASVSVHSHPVSPMPSPGLQSPVGPPPYAPWGGTPQPMNGAMELQAVHVPPRNVYEMHG